MLYRTQDGTVYTLSGPENAPVLVLIHGLGLNRHIWREFEAKLCTRYRVLSYDLYGHGDSALPPQKPSLTVFSEQLKGLLNTLHIDKCAIAGFSLGGMINRRFAMDYPARVSALAILNSPHQRSPEAQKLVEERAVNSTDGPGATLDATIKRWFTPCFIKNEPGYINQVREWVLANDAENFALCRQVLATGVLELIRPQPPIRNPALVITCENDSGSTPEMSHAIASEIQGAKTVIAQGLQHMGLAEQPALFMQPLFEFLHDVLKNEQNPIQRKT